jgi:hypothetical protein
MLLLTPLPALRLEESLSLSTLHLHEGLTHTEPVSGDFMPARDDRWLQLPSGLKRKQLKVAKFKASHLTHQGLWNSQRCLGVGASRNARPPAPPTGWYCKTHSESTQHCITEFTLPSTQDCQHNRGLLASLWRLGYCQNATLKLKQKLQHNPVCSGPNTCILKRR